MRSHLEASGMFSTAFGSSPPYVEEPKMVMKGGRLYTVRELMEPFSAHEKLSRKSGDSKVEWGGSVSAKQVKPPIFDPTLKN
jgi:hypothetical protein